MTNEIDALKTNELARRRKLRLQQVREQSKDIAKKIRQRAKVEKLKQVDELDSKKQREYFHRQEQLVKKLEEFYAKGLEKVGAAHKSASELKEQVNQTEKVDASKQRGREAAVELRKKRQEKLDEQKKVLDRKLQAREAANEVSREKSATLAQKLSKAPNKDIVGQNRGTSDLSKHVNSEATGSEVKCIDMGTQWDCEPGEWEPNIPELALPQDDRDSVKEPSNNIEIKSDKSKRLDLFALSEEMPSSLRGGLTAQEERVPVKPSLTLVSEYLQNRGLRLRDTAETKKKNVEELHSLKQTILRSRTSKAGLTAKECVEKTSKSNNNSNSAMAKKSSVTIYNHSTRNVRDLPYSDERLVVRDPQLNDDAYSLALKESSLDIQENPHKKVQENRSRVAMNKQNVEKEYRDTISFLNSLPKDKGDKPIRRAYMDEDRQQLMNENRQQKLQHEYQKVVKECKRHNCRSKTKSKSPTKTNDFESSDFQYSWMPVPEQDGKLAIHTIPTSLNEGKSGNTVKFSSVDSYHEYRSQHKHTPPTRDTSHKHKQRAEALVQNSSDIESVASDTSSSEVIKLKRDRQSNNTDKVSDSERIIIYKILDADKEKSKNNKIMKNIEKTLLLINQQTKIGSETSKESKNKKYHTNSENGFAFEELKEGAYETTVNGTGDNIASMYYKGGEKRGSSEAEPNKGRPCCCGNTFSKDPQEKETGKWERGDNTQEARCVFVRPPCSSKSSCSGKCVCNQPNAPKIPEEPTQTSAATSTASFKTAGNDKANNAVPDGGYIKLIDEGGEEAGKLYVGASDFLKDDAYEVVIQLRKKGDEMRELHPELVKLNGQQDNNVPESIEIVETVDTAEGKADNSNSNKAKDSNVSISNVDVVESGIAISNRSSESTNQQSANVKQFAEKGVATSFHESITPIIFPKTESNSRPATSAYTQTSMSSPNHRPVFFHMSSSTSTAYMSPPEMILPKFLKQDYNNPNDEMYERGNFVMQDQIEGNSEHEYSEEFECNCNKCRRSRKRFLGRPTGHKCKKATHKPNRITTPPNTVRGEEDDVHYNVFKQARSKVNCRCRKCQRNNMDDPISSSSQINMNKHTNHLMPQSNPCSTSNRNLGKKTKSNMNPIIREYVNKLLELNQTSRKAIQVIDQDCSDVPTPGSSVINLPSNNNSKKTDLENKISLEQIKTIIKEQLIKELETKSAKSNSKYSVECSENYVSVNKKPPKIFRKSQQRVHKVKSLNISRNILRSTKASDNKTSEYKRTSSSSSTRETLIKIPPLPNRNKVRSSSSPRSTSANPEVLHKKAETFNAGKNILQEQNNLCTKSTNGKHSSICSKTKSRKTFVEPRVSESSGQFPSHRATSTASKPDIPNLCDTGTTQEMTPFNIRTPSNFSTQTSINSELNYLKFDEDKIQNMEKIADLTEKCTKRLSNLAKVLDEVRRNKSLAYSQMTTSDDSDQKSDKIDNYLPAAQQSIHDSHISGESARPENVIPIEDLHEDSDYSNHQGAKPFVPFLTDIPKPDSFQTPVLDLNVSSNLSNKSYPPPESENDDYNIKVRGKPPPALSRIHLKHVQDFLIPHELSTVVEVDSPMSVKLKSQSSRNDVNLDAPESSNRADNATYKADNQSNDRDPDLLTSNVDIPGQLKSSYTALNKESLEDSKIQMIDMNQFNEIMLKPFFSLQEYAKYNNIGNVLEDGSNLDDFAKVDVINDEMSSLHSDASLPDVISELLKRNIISEPFKFDTGSNINSTTVSSESTMSVLALSKMRKREKKSSVMFKNKEAVAETSDTLSISSNPDLENAFQRLGLGWASSTLKKTKERLALSSSTNTSSSSSAQFKIKSFNHNTPALVTDTVSSVLNVSNKKSHQKRNSIDMSKSAEQQTSLTNSMTVKEFLTNELAKKITFNNKTRDDTEEVFVSLFETKMPEDMKDVSRMVREDFVDASVRSNRARTSTPVQLFKSMTYQSSSSSNMSNGLFSNADDLSSVKHTSNSMKNHSTSDKDDLTIPNFSLRVNKNGSSE